MGKDWTVFSSYFTSKSKNKAKYQTLREPVSDALSEVELHLRAQGTGELPADALATQQAQWGVLFGLLHDADRTLDRSRPAAISAIIDLAGPAQTLLEDTVEARASAERRERQRRVDEAAYTKKLDGALALLASIKAHGLPDPEPLTTNLTSGQALIAEVAEEGDFVRATGLLDGLTAGLEELWQVACDFSFIKTRRPDGLSTTQSEQLDTWEEEITAAVAKGDGRAAQDPLGAYRHFVLSHERVKGAKDLLSTLDPRERMKALRLRVDDVVDFPAEFRSPAVTAARKKVITAHLLAEQATTRMTLIEGLMKRRQQVAGEVPESMQESLTLTRAEANEAVDDLDKELIAGAKVLSPHITDMRAYYKKLKKLQPRVTLAQSLPEQDSGVDTAWKAEKQTFVLALAAVKAEVDPPKRDYKQGLVKLALLKDAIDAVVNARLAAIAGDITTATRDDSGSSKKALDVLIALNQTPGLIKALAPDKQLALLKTLRTGLFFCTDCDLNFTEAQFIAKGYKCHHCNSDAHLEVPAYCSDTDCKQPGLWTPTKPCTACGNDDWMYDRDLSTVEVTTDSGGLEDHPNKDLAVARALILSEMELTPEFEAYDKQKRKEVIEAIRSDDQWETAQAEWANWAAEGPPFTKIVAYVNRVLALQCGIFGHDQKGLVRDGTTFTDAPVKVRITTPAPPEPNLAGQCEPGFPTWLELNSTYSQFTDFKEVIDTIVHENSHAFQEMLIKKLKAEAPFTALDATALENDPNLGLQAKLFLENDETYINREDLEDDVGTFEDLAGRAYRHEPLEEHAWTVGGVISGTLLVPPPVESFQSKKTLRSKTWAVESLTRGPNAQVKLTQRHGIYVDEWEGEQAGDKKLILENVGKDGGRTTLDVRIRTVVDEYTLMLWLDTSTYDAHKSVGTQVAADGATLRLDETVTDL